MRTDQHAMIQATSLSKRYRSGHVEKVALCQVSLAIPRAEFWIVSGPSGSGKTTLLALLAGMIAPTEGEVVLDGKSITHLRDHHRALARRNLVGMVFQEFALVAGMTLAENIFLPLVPQGGPGETERQRVRALLERFGMAAYARTQVERLSAGERQRGAIIRALVADAPILMLDEPTAALDTENVRIMVDLLLSLRAEGRTIVATTHDRRLTEDPRLNGVLRLVDGRLER
ncbi:MAG: ATP-binding cassette domain-containing protein [Verrucomicrobia bacterium]|nr:ATP-binding cassette domain-containing protein [Verrucomicrobiota bacterium]